MLHTVSSGRVDVKVHLAGSVLTSADQPRKVDNSLWGFSSLQQQQTAEISWAAHLTLRVTRSERGSPGFCLAPAVTMTTSACPACFKSAMLTEQPYRQAPSDRSSTSPRHFCWSRSTILMDAAVRSWMSAAAVAAPTDPAPARLVTVLDSCSCAALLALHSLKEKTLHSHGHALLHGHGSAQFISPPWETHSGICWHMLRVACKT